MTLTGIEKGDSNYRHFTFDDDHIVNKGGEKYYMVNYGKNKIEGDFGEDEISFVKCKNVIVLGGKKAKPFESVQVEEKAETKQETEHTEVIETQEENKPVDKKPEPIQVAEREKNMFEYIKRFEYIVEEFGDDGRSQLNERLNALGKEGWEMCGFETNKKVFGEYQIIAIFKREV